MDPVPWAMVQYWTRRVRYLLADGDPAGASALADTILDAVFPGRWGRP